MTGGTAVVEAGPALCRQSTDMDSTPFTICQYYSQGTRFETGTRNVDGCKPHRPMGKDVGRDGSGKAVADGVRCGDGERKAEPVRKVYGDWQSRDWKGEGRHPTLAERDARWSGRQETQDAEAQASKVIAGWECQKPNPDRPRVRGPVEEARLQCNALPRII